MIDLVKITTSVNIPLIDEVGEIYRCLIKLGI